MQGTVHPQFARVADVFRRQLRSTDGGAAVAVYYRGDPVVDLWGGSREGDDPWQADTLAMSFSTTKGVASTALHILADRGLVDYDAPVARYWPEFAQSGKDRITVKHVLTHSAGLHRMRSLVDHAERMLDWDHMTEALARAEPAYEPGTANGYHALTYGWLVGEIVRRVDGRPIEQFVADEIAGPLGLDGLFIGCPPEQRHRVAPLAPLQQLEVAQGPLRVVRELERRVGKEMGKLVSMTRSPVNPRRMLNALVPRGVHGVLLDEAVMSAAIPAANGFFSARSLARMYAMLAGFGRLDDTVLLSPETVDRIRRVQSTRADRVLVMPMGWRLGYHSVLTTRGLHRAGFGHFGLGGSGGWADPERDLALGFVCNRGTGTPIGDLRILQLNNAAISAASRSSRRYARLPGSVPVAAR